LNPTTPTDGAPDLAQIADAARASGRIALDTEFMGAHEPAWRRWIGVLSRSRAQHATLLASLTSLPCVPVGGAVEHMKGCDV
jgi:hypothetical protein